MSSMTFGKYSLQNAEYMWRTLLWNKPSNGLTCLSLCLTSRFVKHTPNPWLHVSFTVQYVSVVYWIFVTISSAGSAITNSYVHRLFFALQMQFRICSKIWSIAVARYASNPRQFAFAESRWKILRCHLVSADYTRFLLCTKHAEVMTKFIA
jgi:hypothetical protein